MHIPLPICIQVLLGHDLEIHGTFHYIRLNSYDYPLLDTVTKLNPIQMQDESAIQLQDQPPKTHVKKDNKSTRKIC